MLDFAWSEIALIGVVALVLIGPKDLPVAIKTITALIKKARRMAAEFQSHVDDMVKDTELQDVRNSIREIRSLDIRGTITRTLDSDGSIRSAMSDPMRTPPPVLPDSVKPVDPLPEHTIAAPVGAGAGAEPAVLGEAAAVDPLAFVPPAFNPPENAMLPLGGSAAETLKHTPAATVAAEPAAVDHASVSASGASHAEPG